MILIDIPSPWASLFEWEEFLASMKELVPQDDAEAADIQDAIKRSEAAIAKGGWQSL